MAQWWRQALGNTCPLDVPASPEGLISTFMEQSSGAAAVVCPGASPNQSPCVRSVAPAGIRAPPRELLVVLWSQASLPEARAQRELPRPKAQPEGRAYWAEGGRPSRARGAQQTLHGSPVIKTALIKCTGHRFNPWSET